MKTYKSPAAISSHPREGHSEEFESYRTRRGYWYASRVFLAFSIAHSHLSICGLRDR